MSFVNVYQFECVFLSLSIFGGMLDLIVVAPFYCLSFTLEIAFELFLTYGTEFALFFSGAAKFCLANGLRQLTHGVKSDLRTLNSRSDVISAPPRETPNDIRKRSLCDVKCQK